MSRPPERVVTGVAAAGPHGLRGYKVAGDHFFLSDLSTGVVDLLNRELGAAG